MNVEWVFELAKQLENQVDEDVMKLGRVRYKCENIYILVFNVLL